MAATSSVPKPTLVSIPSILVSLARRNERDRRFRARRRHLEPALILLVGDIGPYLEAELSV